MKWIPQNENIEFEIKEIENGFECLSYLDKENIYPNRIPQELFEEKQIEDKDTNSKAQFDILVAEELAEREASQ